MANHYVILNNRLTYSDKAHLSVQDRGFRLGDGVFETIAVYHGIPYQWELHMERLQAGLQALSIPADISKLRQQSLKLISKNELSDATLRIAISRGVGSEGYLPTTHGGSATILIEATARTTPPAHPAALYLSSYEKISPRALPVQCKLAQGVNSTLARMEAAQHGCLDGLQRNTSGHICESGSANIFWKKGDVLYTPSLECGVLDGTTRAAILRCSPYKTEEGTYTLDALEEADAVVVTNTHWQAMPVTQLKPKGWKWDASDALAQELRSALKKDIADYVARATA